MSDWIKNATCIVVMVLIPAAAIGVRCSVVVLGRLPASELDFAFGN